VFFAAALFAPTAGKQTAPWAEVNADRQLPSLAPANLPESRRKAIERLMTKDPAFNETWDCSPEDMKELLAGLQFQSVDVGKGHDVVLIQAGQGCARGGQGSNGAMWLVRFDGDKPSYIATPANDFNGWLYSIQPAVSHGYRDIVLGWHMSAGEFGLSYFRFDGKLYRQIGSATATVDGDDTKITPK
jgi:hypothetical protein